MVSKKWKVKKKKDIKIQEWILHVHTSPNNTIITLTNDNGDKVLWWGTGRHWFKWAKQNTPYAAEVLAKEMLKEAKNYGLEQVGVVFKWTGMWREWVFKAINELGLVEIMYITEKTPIQFGWCKGKRPKRN